MFKGPSWYAGALVSRSSLPGFKGSVTSGLCDADAQAKDGLRRLSFQDGCTNSRHKEARTTHLRMMPEMAAMSVFYAHTKPYAENNKFFDIGLYVM